MDFLTKKKEEPKKEGEDKDKEEGKDDSKPTGAEGEAKDKEARVCSMKRGDYMIHVMVEQAKEL